MTRAGQITQGVVQDRRLRRRYAEREAFTSGTRVSRGKLLSTCSLPCNPIHDQLKEDSP